MASKNSVYDELYFTPAELEQADRLRAAAEQGQTSWASAHDYVEGLRSQYGYSGGQYGNEYIKLDQNAGKRPAYTGSYSRKIEAQRGEIEDRQPFSYDYQTDPGYAAYRKEYVREGQRAAEETLGKYAVMTGGMPSTAAVTASQQSGDYYAAQLADKIPELRQLAYSMYLDEGARMQQNLENLMDLQDAEYKRYQGRVDAWEKDRDYQYDLERDAVKDQRYEREYADDRADAAAKLALQQARTAVSSGGSGKGGGTSPSPAEDFEGLYASAWASENPQNYISSHYKEHGFKSSAGLLGSQKEGTGYYGWRQSEAANGQRLYKNDFSALVTYAQKMRDFGRSEDYMRSALKNQGYSDTVIDLVFRRLTA